MNKLFLVLIILASPRAGADTEQRQIPMQTYGASTYSIDSEIPGAGKFSMLIDTGSAYSVINEETLATLSHRRQR